MQNKLFTIIFTTVFITSCGGGGGGGSNDGYTPPAPPANNAPTFANVGTIAVPENTTTIGTVTASDADGDTLTYSLTGDDASLISIVSTTGALTFNTAPDYENPSSASGDNNYSITVVASDGSATGSVGIVISVTDVDEDTNSAPNITSSASFSVVENSTAIGTVKAEDSDGDTLTFSVSGTNISIGASTGALTFDSAPTYNSDGNNAYQATVQVTDGVATDSQEITITITEQSASTNASDLFISEYAEGSSNNKYLEIFNATGSSVNLNDYAIRSKVNGNNVYYNDYFEPNYVLEDKSLYCLLYTSPSPRDLSTSRMPSSA